MFSFEVDHTCGKSRAGRLTTPHGQVLTPVFMPVGTAGSVKAVTPAQVRETGMGMVLANTYHLMLRPGATTVAQLGGLHKLMAWDGPILTDSGGYQVFSLAHLRSISKNGVVFRSHIDGSEVLLDPTKAMEVQRLLGADIVMQLDECPSAQADRKQVADAVSRSADWASRCKQCWLAQDCCSAATSYQALFGIQQGGTYPELRRESARRLLELDLPGYAIGGVRVGEDHQAMCDILDEIDDQLPASKPRYLMGVGEPRDIIAAVERGIDMFDCVLPTRNARNAQVFTWHGRIRLRNAAYTHDDRPIEESCDCYTCRNFSRGTLRHLFMAKEMLAATLATIHNLRFFANFMSAIRNSIQAKNFHSQAKMWLSEMANQRLDRPG